MGAIVAAAHCTVTPASGGAYIVTKSSGVDGAEDSSAVSTAPEEGDFVLRARLLGAGTAYAGVSANPLAGTQSAEIERALQLSASGMRAFELGVGRSFTFPVDGFAWIRRSGGGLQFLSGPELETAAVRRSGAALAGPFYFDSTILTLGLALEVKFGAPEEFLTRRRPGRQRLSLGFGL